MDQILGIILCDVVRKRMEPSGDDSREIGHLVPPHRSKPHGLATPTTASSTAPVWPSLRAAW